MTDMTGMTGYLTFRVGTENTFFRVMTCHWEEKLVFHGIGECGQTRHMRHKRHGHGVEVHTRHRSGGTQYPMETAVAPMQGGNIGNKPLFYMVQAVEWVTYR